MTTDDGWLCQECGHIDDDHVRYCPEDDCVCSAEPGVPPLDIGDVSLLGLSIKALRYAVAVADMYHPTWRRDVRSSE